MSSVVAFLILGLFWFPDLNPCTFSFWGTLKHLVSRDNQRTVLGRKDSIPEHVSNISPNTLRSAVKHAILWLQMVADNDGRYVEYVL